MGDAAAKPVVVVGVDDSPLSMTAVRLAAREAALHSRPLRIVHTFNWVADPMEPMPEEPRKPAEELLERAIATATGAQPNLTVTAALIEGPVVTTLLRESGAAALLVVGDGGLTQNPKVPANNDAVAVQLAARAGCSVLVAREQLPAPGPVLVGVDGSVSSLCALDFAFDAASRRSAELVVVQVWDPDDRTTSVPPEMADQLAETVAPWQRKYPSVRVEQHVRAGAPEDTLVEEARRAEVVVVSARGEEPWRGMLGAVSQSMLYHSPAPVIVVRSRHGLYIQE
ncbi:universal stress protein [Micromonospora sp. HM5-17]|uniref:universal stress protein n=1 Tax=Micromonospora sp. HM5-17 TaxID=2487710 RepID=UPI000F476AA3|nr:universal stress protein [Micromonospora sp. HM5-17]ROT33111.1 universal stress protein [Micromonospora sp. HM5-17]